MTKIDFRENQNVPHPADYSFLLFNCTSCFRNESKRQLLFLPGGVSRATVFVAILFYLESSNKTLCKGITDIIKCRIIKVMKQMRAKMVT